MILNYKVFAKKVYQALLPYAPPEEYRLPLWIALGVHCCVVILLTYSPEHTIRMLKMPAAIQASLVAGDALEATHVVKKKKAQTHKKVVHKKKAASKLKHHKVHQTKKIVRHKKTPPKLQHKKPKKLHKAKPVKVKAPTKKPIKKQLVKPKPFKLKAPDLAAQMASESDTLKTEMSALKRALYGQYQQAMLGRIKQFWIVSTAAQNVPACILGIQLSETGKVLDVQIQRSSGNQAVDRSALKAVLQASPLPMPSEASVNTDFRQIELTLDAKDAKI